MDDALQDKRGQLLASLRDMRSVAVAFSAGVDSTLLLYAAHEALGDGTLAITGRSPSLPPRALEEARAFCAAQGIAHVVIDTHEFEHDGFAHNPPNRCYLCKRELLGRCVAYAREHGIEHVAEGSNADDAHAHRPGFAAVRELGVASPLMDAGLTKADVRSLAHAWGLSAWDKPSAACLNSRFEYGAHLTPGALARVDAAEQAIRELGFEQVRVRVHGADARIEVDADDVGRLRAQPARERARKALRELGFEHVSIDPRGYRTGSMDEPSPPHAA